MARAPKKENLTTDDQIAVDTSLESVAHKLRGHYTLMGVRLIGTEVLLVHQWTEKAVIEMLSSMGGHPMPRLFKDLTEEGHNSAYRNMEGADVLPLRVIKACITAGASHTRGAVKKNVFSNYVRIIGHTAPIHWTSINRCDVRTVKVGPWNNRVVDLRARTLYAGWHVDFVIRFPHEIIPMAQVVAALREAGDSVGLCEMRPEKGGELGTFNIEAIAPEEIDGLIQACMSPEKLFEIPQQLLRAASAQIEDLDKRNPKRKMVAVAEGVNSAPERFAADEIATLLDKIARLEALVHAHGLTPVMTADNNSAE